MPHVITVTDESGKQYTVNTDHIVSIEHELGEPAKPAVAAVAEVKDDPGEAPSLTNPQGRPPKKGHPAVEAKPAQAGTPDKAHIKLAGGDTITVQSTPKGLRDALNG